MQNQERKSISKYDLTQETHFARIARAILGPCTDVLREVLTKEISPLDLEKKVRIYMLQNRTPYISERQKKLVYSKNYSFFDLTLLYFLLRYICSIPPHKNKWGKDPELTDRSVSANIERVRILRNQWEYASDIFLSDSDFDQIWNHISHTVKDLEGYLGTATKYQDALIKLKTCCMDPASIQHYMYLVKLNTVEMLSDITILKGKSQVVSTKLIIKLN